MELPQRAPRRTTLAPAPTPDAPGHAPITPSPTPMPPPPYPLRGPRPAHTDRLTYRWERLSTAQREVVWSLIGQMRLTVAEAAWRRRQILLLGVLAALVVLLGVLLLALASLTGAARF